MSLQEIKERLSKRYTDPSYFEILYRDVTSLRSLIDIRVRAAWARGKCSQLDINEKFLLDYIEQNIKEMTREELKSFLEKVISYAHYNNARFRFRGRT